MKPPPLVGMPVKVRTRLCEERRRRLVLANKIIIEVAVSSTRLDLVRRRVDQEADRLPFDEM